MKRSLVPPAPTLLLLVLTALLPGCNTCTGDVAPDAVADPGPDAGDTDTTQGDAPDPGDTDPGDTDPGDTDPGDTDADTGPDVPEEVGPDAEAAVPSGQGVLAGGGVRRSGRFQVKMSVGGPVAGQPDPTDEHRLRTGVGAPQAAEVSPENP